MEEINKFTAQGYEQYKRCLEAGYAEGGMSLEGGEYAVEIAGRRTVLSSDCRFAVACNVLIHNVLADDRWAFLPTCHLLNI